MNLLQGRGKNICYFSSFDLGRIYFSTESVFDWTVPLRADCKYFDAILIISILNYDNHFEKRKRRHCMLQY